MNDRETDDPGRVAEQVMPVVAERVQIDKRTKTHVAARVSLTTHEETVDVETPLRRTWTEVVRTPVDIVTATPPAEWREADGTRVIPIVEEILVRRYRVVEEIRLVEHAETREMRETVTLRRQAVTIDDPTDDAPPAPVA